MVINLENRRRFSGGKHQCFSGKALSNGLDLLLTTTKKNDKIFAVSSAIHFFIDTFFLLTTSFRKYKLLTLRHYFFDASLNMRFLPYVVELIHKHYDGSNVYETTGFYICGIQITESCTNKKNLFKQRGSD
jgi:hypothetical protein